MSKGTIFFIKSGKNVPANNFCLCVRSRQLWSTNNKHTNQQMHVLSSEATTNCFLGFFYSTWFIDSDRECFLLLLNHGTLVRSSLTATWCMHGSWLFESLVFIWSRSMTMAGRGTFPCLTTAYFRHTVVTYWHAATALFRKVHADISGLQLAYEPSTL
jgi:hypothetical protein